MHTPYGFSGLDNLNLKSIYNQKIQITELNSIASLWHAYQNGNTEELLNAAKALVPEYPFIYQAVKAHIERIPSEDNPGRPVQALIEIMNEFGADSFGKVFQEFNRRESIYGYGDLQVKRLYDEIRNKQL